MIHIPRNLAKAINCRLCLRNFTPSAGVKHTICSLKDKIQTIFTFEVTPHEDLSNAVCPECANTVEQFYEYASQVQQNQMRLCQLLVEDRKKQSENSDIAPILPVAAHLIKNEPPEILSEPEESTELEDGINDEQSFHDEIKIEPEEMSIDDTSQNDESASESKPLIRKPKKSLISHHLSMVCGICHENQVTYQRLVNHFKDCHKTECFIFCCGLRLINDQSISKHLETHQALAQEKVSTSATSWATTFGNILTDFKSALVTYGQLPNIELAMKGDATEKRNLYKVQDFLVDTFFDLKCELCGTANGNQKERRKHFRQHHPKEKDFVSCCGQRFSYRISIMRHLNRHWGQVINGKEAIGASASKHRQSVYEPLASVFREELVEAGFNPPADWQQSNILVDAAILQQMQDFIIAKYGQLNCGECETPLTSYAERLEHFRQNHPTEKMYIQCCGSKLYGRYRTVLHFFHHKIGHTSGRNISSSIYCRQDGPDAIIEEYYKMDCELCDYKGTSYSKLRSHFQMFHREQGFFITCCNRKLKYRYNIIDHIATHRAPGSVKCEHCPATFSNQRGLKAHNLRKHANADLKIFQCDQCSDKFAFQSLLVLHQRRKHELWPCELCGAKMQRNSLRVHKINFHKMGKEIMCEVCSKLFYSQHMYNQHYRNVHQGLWKRWKPQPKGRKRSTKQNQEQEAASTKVTATKSRSTRAAKRLAKVKVEPEEEVSVPDAAEQEPSQSGAPVKCE